MVIMNVNPAPPQAPPAPPVANWMARAQALGLNADESILFEVMTNFHNFTEAQYESLRDQGGYGTLDDLNQWSYKDIKAWGTSMSQIPTNRGGRAYGDLKIRKLQGLAWWVTDCKLRSKPLNINEYKADDEGYRLNAEMDYRESEADAVTVDKPEAFEYKDWIKWEESVHMYFDSIKNLKGVPLSYVIRKDLPAGTTLPSLERKDQIIYSAPLNGYLFDKDTKTVLNIISEACLGTDAESWIKNVKCGRAAMEALRTHYDGPDEARKRLADARAKLKNLFYKHEATFSFEKYVTALNSIFLIHERYNEPIYESNKVEYLLDKCQNSHPEFKQEVVVCRSRHDTFNGAVIYMKTAVARLFPNGGRGPSRKRTIAALKGNDKKIINGVDVSDMSRWFEGWELKKLPNKIVRKIMQNKDHNKKNKDVIDKIKKSKVKSLKSDRNQDNDDHTAISEEQQNRMVAAVINGVANASRTSQSTIAFPQNGRTAAVSSAQSNLKGNNKPVDSSTIIFDHPGNRV